MFSRGQYKVSISKITDNRLKRVTKAMIQSDPEKYPEAELISYNDVIEWMIDKLRESQVI